MAIRDKMRANAAPYLEPGETIQAVFGAQTTSAYFVLISIWIIIFANAYRVIIVTDKRILVGKSGRMSTTPVKEIIRELPRSTRIGAPTGLWWRSESMGEKLYVHKRYHKDVVEADSLAV